MATTDRFFPRSVDALGHSSSWMHSGCHQRMVMCSVPTQTIRMRVSMQFPDLWPTVSSLTWPALIVSQPTQQHQHQQRILQVRGGPTPCFNTVNLNQSLFVGGA
jgi:hypothetical protein